jgi:hypothetical protein
VIRDFLRITHHVSPVNHIFVAETEIIAYHSMPIRSASLVFLEHFMILLDKISSVSGDYPKIDDHDLYE